MDKNILKKFAIESRQDLMKKIEVKLKTYYVDEEFSKEQKNDIYVLTNDKHSLNLTDEQYKKRELLVKRIKDLSLEQVIEEAAYTWFNRIIAIRYMELNDMLPLTKSNSSLGIRVLSSKDNKPDPEILKFTNLANPDLDINLKKEQYAKLTEESKFEYVLLLVCKKLGRVIPQVFDGITDYIDILIPDNLLNDTGFINKVVSEIPENNFRQVEVIGWLYQYYNQTEKDRVISAKKAYEKTEIPYATQLFTPDWIVKYMVENSLGRYWLEHTNNKSIKENWKYYIDREIESEEKIQPTDITFIDPCSGSGHILVYAFEVLYQIYQSAGYNKTNIPELILKNNICGLEIDDRAGQLSILSILLKAREYDKSIFNKDVVRNLNIVSIQESVNVQDYAIDNLPESVKEKALYLKDVFVNAKEIGSLLLIENKDYSDLVNSISKELTLDTYHLRECLVPLIKQAEILSKKYDVVVTNPPYMNRSVMSENLKNYINLHFESVNSDLFSSFILRNSFFGNENAHLGFMTPYVWMFISSYEKLRKYIVDKLSISSLIQFEYSAFEEATVPICSFVLRNNSSVGDGIYYRLTDFKGGMEKQKEMVIKAIDKIDTTYTYKMNCKRFNDISSFQIAYWISEDMFSIFKNYVKLGEIASPRQGLSTTNNSKFIRFWYEIAKNNIKRYSINKKDAQESQKRWFPYNNGGQFRKWYGNELSVVNWLNNGCDIKEYIKNKNPNVARGETNYFLKCISWNLISSSNFGVRCYPNGMIFDVAAHSLFCDDKNYYYFAGLLNSIVVRRIVDVLNPTLNMSSGVVANIPVVIEENKHLEVTNIVKENVELSTRDWDSYEVSFDFKKHPLLEFAIMSVEKIKTEEKSGYLVENNIEDAFENWDFFCNQRFNQLKYNEEKLNRIFIDIYGLENEFTPNVEEKDVTVSKADKVREIKSLISYAVGCMFGRYSLDEDGLIYAGGNFEPTKYKTFKVDNDNVIPITDESYFADDIVSRFKNFIEMVYGKGTLNENMDFIAETLGKKGTETSEATIRRYFNNDFYNDHIKMYQKKPIYWLFDSGKKNGFKCLVYMHRYNDGLVAKVRLDYLHRIQTTYERLLNDVSSRLSNEDLDINTKKELQKQQVDLSSKLQETIEYDEKIAHIANQRINIDLDDGVTVNYSKFVYINPKTNKEESILGQIK